MNVKIIHYKKNKIRKWKGKRKEKKKRKKKVMDFEYCFMWHISNPNYDLGETIKTKGRLTGHAHI